MGFQAKRSTGKSNQVELIVPYPLDSCISRLEKGYSMFYLERNVKRSEEFKAIQVNRVDNNRAEFRGIYRIQGKKANSVYISGMLQREIAQSTRVTARVEFPLRSMGCLAVFFLPVIVLGFLGKFVFPAVAIYVILLIIGYVALDYRSMAQASLKAFSLALKMDYRVYASRWSSGVAYTDGSISSSPTQRETPVMKSDPEIEHHAENSDPQKCLRCDQLFDPARNTDKSCSYHPARKPSFSLINFHQAHGLPRFNKARESNAFVWEHMDDDGTWWYWPCCGHTGQGAMACKKGRHVAEYRFGETLRNIRIEQGMELEELARKLAFKQEYIRELEDGKVKPSLNLIYRISKLFDVSFDRLIDREIEEEIPKRERDELMKYREFEKKRKRTK